MLKPQLWFAIGDGGRAAADTIKYNMRIPKRTRRPNLIAQALMCPQAKINDGIV